MLRTIAIQPQTICAVLLCTVSCTLLHPTAMQTQAISAVLKYLVPCCTPLQSNPKLFALSCSILYPAAPYCNATPSYLHCLAVSCTLLHPTAKQPQAVCAVYCTVSCTLLAAAPHCNATQAICIVLQYLVPCCTSVQSNPKLFSLSCSIFYPAAPYCNPSPSYLHCFVL
jgi:hypothetical protein